MAISASDQLEVAGIVSVVSLLTGSAPAVDTFEDRVVITLTPAQAVALRSIASNWLDSADGPVQVDLKPVLVPLILQRSLPYVLGAVAITSLFFIFRGKSHGR